MPRSSFSECWVLSQLFCSPLSLSSRGSPQSAWDFLCSPLLLVSRAVSAAQGGGSAGIPGGVCCAGRGGWPLPAAWYAPPCFSASPPLSSGVRAFEATGTGPHVSGARPLWGWGVRPHTTVTQTVLERTQWGLCFAACVTAELVTSP